MKSHTYVKGWGWGKGTGDTKCGVLLCILLASLPQAWPLPLPLPLLKPTNAEPSGSIPAVNNL